ncbi:hypothetical protein [Bradyrhizobium genosp. P]|uniref:hypothetical protein n=1 Tax=Bradyrhizobium genosp. P TaxID=83641 RepID=UPI003CEDE7D0
MDAILQFLREDGELDAIEEFRSAFHTDLKTAEDAIHSIQDAYPPVYVSDEYLLISRVEVGAPYEVTRFMSKLEARDHAEDLLASRVEVVVPVTMARSMREFMLDYQ